MLSALGPIRKAGDGEGGGVLPALGPIRKAGQGGGGGGVLSALGTIRKVEGGQLSRRGGGTLYHRYSNIYGSIE